MREEEIQSLKEALRTSARVLCGMSLGRRVLPRVTQATGSLKSGQGLSHRCQCSMFEVGGALDLFALSEIPS